MDRKIHIHFFPRDASRVRVIRFPRSLGIAAVVIAFPLCLFGFWLALSGALREEPARKFERRKLERENDALGEKTALLENETRTLRKSLDSLESVRIRVTMASGLESQAPAPAERKASRFWPFAARSNPRGADFSRVLGGLRKVSLFLDSSLFVLNRQADKVANLPTIYPVGSSALVIRPYGPAPDPFTGHTSLHGGVDFSLPPGSPVHAAGGGSVVSSEFDPLWGNCVRLRHANGSETFYAHLQQANVRTNQLVQRGQIIGWVGESGSTTGPHLHFELTLRGERVDPLAYLLPENGTL